MESVGSLGLPDCDLFISCMPKLITSALRKGMEIFFAGFVLHITTDDLDHLSTP